VPEPPFDELCPPELLPPPAPASVLGSVFVSLEHPLKILAPVKIDAMVTADKERVFMIGASR
jgi:hypothetical protein